MSILQLNLGYTGTQQVNPRRNQLVTTDDLTTITQPRYLTDSLIRPTDIFDVIYNYNEQSGQGTFAQFSVTIDANNSIALSPVTSPADVTLPVVSGNFAVFDGTTGKIKDNGYLPSDETKQKVSMVDGAVTSSRLAIFTDADGTVGMNTTTAFTDGNLQIGTSGNGKYIDYMAPGANLGRLRVYASNNAGNTITEITNRSLNQATTYYLPEVGLSAANLISSGPLSAGNLIKSSTSDGKVQDAGVINAGTDTWGGGGTTHDFSAIGVGGTGVTVVSLQAQSNAAYIVSYVVTADTITVNFSADPGAGTVLAWSFFELV